MVETPLIQVWLESAQAQLPFTVPTAALIGVLLLAAFVFFQMLRILLTSATRSTSRSPSPHYTGATDADGRYHGHGALRLLNGNRYTGEFAHGVFDGQGVYTFKSTGTQYDGQWANGVKEGRGRETYSDGSVYVGEYRAGEREGRGRMEYGGERGVFDGGWKHGKKHGEGKVREKANGKWRWRKGVWVDGRLQKPKVEGEAEEVVEEEGEQGVETAGADEQLGIRQRNNVQSQPQQQTAGS